MRGRLFAVLVALLPTLACSAQQGTAAVGSDAPRDEVSRAAVGSDDPYVALAEALRARGVEIWWEADLVARWLEGPQQLAEAVDRLGVLADVPGVVGFKVADELGYDDGLDSVEDVRAFLRDAHDALEEVAPGKDLLVDMVVPELGCVALEAGAEWVCTTAARRAHPGATVDAVDGYLDTGLVDVLDLSSGLLDETAYEQAGGSRRQAQEEAWAEVTALGWSEEVRLQARKALAGPGGSDSSPREAAEDVAVYVDIPVAAGAEAVDLWTWRQPYDGDVVSLLGPDLAPNPLWKALRARSDAGVHLFTHMTPSAMPTEPHAFAREVEVAAEVFDSVFVAAGTG